MKKFNIEIMETLAKVIEVEAENSAEAISKVKENYYNNDYVLSADDFVDVKFLDIDEEIEPDEEEQDKEGLKVCLRNCEDCLHEVCKEAPEQITQFKEVKAGCNYHPDCNTCPEKKCINEAGNM